MTVYTNSEAKSRLDTLLAEAMQGEVRIRREDGREFVVRPLPPAGSSALDVGSITLDPPITAQEIVAIVREGRERSY